MSGLPREAPCTGNINNSCPQTNEEILGRLKNLSLIYPPWSRPSYRYFTLTQSHAHAHMRMHMHTHTQSLSENLIVHGMVDSIISVSV